jgi:alkaline phosphatase D
VPLGVKPQPSAPVATHEFFQHGVASGDPLPTAVVLWTRVTPTADATPGSGRGPSATVAWQVATDATFRRPVRSGAFTTSAERDHTVKVDVTGLNPETTYFYRFVFQGPWRDAQVSPVGRTHTAPAADALPERLRLGVVSCANLQAGWFTAYRHLAERDDLHAVLHLGDYLYEYGPGGYGYGADDVDIRVHDPAHEIVSLADYRQRHAQYKQDPDLAALHRRYAFITTWDDHESANDAWQDGAENHDPATEGEWSERKAHAARAYDEWMPIRMEGTAALDDGTRMYRRFRFGQLAELTMLDLRSYRDQQVAMGSPDAADPDRTLTGADQMAFLKDGLRPDAPQWRLVGNPVTIAPFVVASLPQSVQDLLGGLGGGAALPSTAINLDQWDGYTADRTEILDHIVDQGVRDVVFLTGDIHSSWANDLPYPSANSTLYSLLGGSAGVEFVGPSVTSNNVKDYVPSQAGAPTGVAAGEAAAAAVQQLNPHIKYLDLNNHGFMVVDVTPARVQSDWFFISERADPEATLRHGASWATSTGTGVVHRVKGPVQ